MTTVSQAEGAYTAATGAAADLASSARNQEHAQRQERHIDALKCKLGGEDWSKDSQLFKVRCLAWHSSGHSSGGLLGIASCWAWGTAGWGLVGSAGTG